MATLTDTKPTIAAIGHVYIGPVDTPPPSLDNYVFDPSEDFGGFTWLGDSSAENLIEFETDGGDVTYKHTWDRPNVRAVRENESISATINSVNAGKETFLAGFGGSVRDEATKSTKVGVSSTSVPQAIFVVMEDGQDVAGMYLPNTDVKGSFPTFSREEFTEIPLNVAVLGSNTQTAGASGPLAWQWFEPRAKVTAGA